MVRVVRGSDDGVIEVADGIQVFLNGVSGYREAVRVDQAGAGKFLHHRSEAPGPVQIFQVVLSAGTE